MRRLAPRPLGPAVERVAIADGRILQAAASHEGAGGAAPDRLAG